jgi:hypothetical protein
MLEIEIKSIERELNALKEAQIIGRSNTQVKNNKSATTYDASFTVPASSTRTASIVFTPNLQKNAFFDVIVDVYINGVLQRSGNNYEVFYNDFDSASSSSVRKTKLFFTAGGSPFNVDIKCYVNSVDSGSVSVAVS